MNRRLLIIVATATLGISTLALSEPGAIATGSSLDNSTSFAQKTKAPRSVRIELSNEKVGRESAKFLSVVGNWSIVDDGGTKVLAVDGRQWLRGQPAGGLAQKARAIYGSRHEEFIDNVKAFAYFPYAVANGVDDFHDGEISMRFKLLGGQLDQC